MTVDRDAIVEAASRVAGHIRRTPTIDLRIAGVDVVAKLELLQHTGSFKPRGAFNRVLGAGPIPAAGVVTASGGNHGAALAYVARELGLAAEVFVADVTPDLKRDRIAQLGAKVIIGGRQYPDALEASRERAGETGALEVHAYDHELTVAGQGTMAIEIEEQVPDVTTLVMSVGGGGFAAGAAAWFSGRSKVVCVEPHGSRAFHEGQIIGRPVNVDIDSIASDSLGARSIGAVPFALLMQARAQSVLVDDDAIREAQRWLWDRLRLIVEPGGAAATAALLSGAYQPGENERVVVVVCGANADPATIV